MKTATVHTPTCRNVDGTRILNQEHLRDCNASGCEGCAPCRPEHGHCERCHHAHLDASHPRTCPSCVGKVRQHILKILDQVDEAHAQLVHRSINSVGFMVSGPAANYEAHSFVHQSATSGRLCKCARRGLPCPADLPPFTGPVCKSCSHETCRAARRPRICPDAAFILEQTRLDDQHPLTVLAAWDVAWRRALGHEPLTVTPGTGEGLDYRALTGGPIEADVTLTTTSTYLLKHLTHMAQQPDDITDFDQFAREIAACSTWLDDVLRLGHRPDRGVDCPVCGKERLVKAWDDEDEGAEEYDEQRLTKPYNDLWTCPNPGCAQTWTEQEYRERVQGIYVGVADRLTASEIQKTYRVPEGTIRRWANGWTTGAGVRHDPVVRKRGHDAAGRQLYDVSDVVRERDRRATVAS